MKPQESVSFVDSFLCLSASNWQQIKVLDFILCKPIYHRKQNGQAEEGPVNEKRLSENDYFLQIPKRFVQGQVT